MSQLPDPANASGPNDLQFEKVEATAVADSPQFQGPTCAACRQPLEDAYYAAGAKLICPRCRDTYVATLSSESGMARFRKATFLGILNGVLGAAIWYAVRKITHLEIGLVAVLVGFLVGRGVQNGSARQGGRRYQILAVILTYAAIAASYYPIVMEFAMKRPSLTYIDIFMVSIATLKMPILVGMHSPLTLLIAAFALWEAWKLNNSRAPKLSGPYSIAIGGVPGPQARTSR